MLKKMVATFLAVLVSLGVAGYEAKASSYGVIEDGTNRTLVPLRMIADTFSVPVKWDNVNKVVTIDEIYTLAMGSKAMKKNGVVLKQMDTQPKMVQNAVYVPVREVAFLFDVPMNWDQVNQQVTYQVGENTYKILVYKEAAVNKPKVSVSKRSVNAGGKNFSVNIVSVNLLAPNTSLHVELANNKLGSVGKLASIAKVNQAVVAMNGNYFDAYTNSSNRTVYNGLVMNGERVKVFDPKFSVFYYTKDGDVGILPGAQFMELFQQGNIQEALQIGPRLLTNGAVTLNPVAEGFKDQKVLSSPGARSAIGISKDRQILFVTTPGATIGQLASIMKQLGAVDAMNFDGGASSGLYANGKYLTTPGRDIAVALMVK